MKNSMAERNLKMLLMMELKKVINGVEAGRAADTTTMRYRREELFIPITKIDNDVNILNTHTRFQTQLDIPTLIAFRQLEIITELIVFFFVQPISNFIHSSHSFNTSLVCWVLEDCNHLLFYKSKRKT